MQLRHTATTLALLATLTGLTACGGDGDPGTQPSSSPSSPSEPSPTNSSAAEEPGGPPAGWEDQFTREQLNTYNSALRRWQRYTELTNEIYRKGQDTPEARAVLKEYDLFWQRDIVTLAETYDQGGLREEVPAEPLWTYATTIKPGYVEIVQCTDYSNIRYTKNGDVLDNKPKNLITPLIIRMGKPAGRDWMHEGSTLKDKTSCAA